MQPESKSDADQQRADSEPPDRQAQSAAPRGRPFVKGQSGNPAGRPSRARQAAVVAEALIGRRTVPLTNKAIDLALAGDRVALRLCLDRIMPRRREAPIALPLPPIAGTADIGAAMAAVVNAAATGAVTSAQAGALARVVTTFIRAIETGDFERRLTELEAWQKGRR
jgi:hypothetical protein